ncbi:transcription termination factor MTEF18, mitochondrial-like [Neltuma alba]|uniref:transcription termination factor MTEF18, mitochondrial-like n=1 Tax=Neltuma alba TaxID=207710 RepID=UPI0010A4C110|nr:transcription termination factor MTEF18, mitochondrial-like [Prosopis alba]
MDRQRNNHETSSFFDCACTCFLFCFFEQGSSLSELHEATAEFERLNYKLASTLSESDQGKWKLGVNESFTVSYLMSSLGLSRKVATEVSKKVQLKNPDKPNSVLNLFRSYGFSDTQISIVVKMHPRVLSANPEKTLLPKLRFLQSIGLSSSELQDVLISNYCLLGMSLEQCIIPCFEALRSFLDNDEEAKIALKRFKWLRSRQGVTNLAQNIMVLRDIGVPRSSISLLATKYIDSAFLNHANFVEYVQFAKEAGVDPSKSLFINAVAVLGRLKKSTWQSKLDIFKRYGWTRDVTLSVFSKHPQCLMLSEKNITKSMSFLVDEVGIPLEGIAARPKLLHYSLEQRIIPRYSVIKVLKMKGLVKKNISFISIVSYTEKKFVEKFVTRFHESVPQLLNIYKGPSGRLSKVQ